MTRRSAHAYATADRFQAYPIAAMPLLDVRPRGQPLRHVETTWRSPDPGRSRFDQPSDAARLFHDGAAAFQDQASPVPTGRMRTGADPGRCHPAPSPRFADAINMLSAHRVGQVGVRPDSDVPKHSCGSRTHRKRQQPAGVYWPRL